MQRHNTAAFGAPLSAAAAASSTSKIDLFEELRAEGLNEFLSEATRQQAAEMVSVGQPGSFIIRPSSQHRCVALTMKKLSGIIDHLLMRRTPEGWQVRARPRIRGCS